MKTTPRIACGPKSGGALATTMIMLSTATFVIGVAFTATRNYSRFSKHGYERERAMFLADAGLRAASFKLLQTGNGVISLVESRDYFSDKSSFEGANWGFSTTVDQRADGSHRIVSSGIYTTKRQIAEISVSREGAEEAVHALFSHAMFAGNNGGMSGYTLEVGGFGSYADFVRGDVYSGGDISVSGNAMLRLPEIINEVVYDGYFDENTETWDEALVPSFFSNALTRTQFDAYVASVSSDDASFYKNGVYDYGEAFIDTIGNGVFDESDWFDDANGNGIRDSGDGYVDNNDNGFFDEGDVMIDRGNGVYDEGEEWVDSHHSTYYYGIRITRRNGRYDKKGQCWLWYNNRWYDLRWSRFNDWPDEQFEDLGDDTFDPGEAWVDRNGVYDLGEEFYDDRNGRYDYGTQAYGAIYGMPAPGIGQKAATGGDALISSPDLALMSYHVNNSGYTPVGAPERWGHDVAVTAGDYGSKVAITDASRPEHIFVRNPPTSGSVSSGGRTIYGRGYGKVLDDDGDPIDDYFLEDPADSSYNSYSMSGSIDGTKYTAPMYVDVRDSANDMLYFVDGNVYIHHPRVYSLKFRRPGTRITIVAKGNITISDEFFYNAEYDPDLTRSEMDSTVVNEASDALCMIALKNPNCADSGNIYIGDAVYGTGGSIHAMLYAERNFVDNNINTSGQPFISVYGNMSAGNQIAINRDTSGGHVRTRLDITLDRRVTDGEVRIPGIPYPAMGQRSIGGELRYEPIAGTWKSWSMIDHEALQ